MTSVDVKHGDRVRVIGGNELDLVGHVGMIRIQKRPYATIDCETCRGHHTFGVTTVLDVELLGSRAVELVVEKANG